MLRRIGGEPLFSASQVERTLKDRKNAAATSLALEQAEQAKQLKIALRSEAKKIILNIGEIQAKHGVEGLIDVNNTQRLIDNSKDENLENDFSKIILETFRNLEVLKFVGYEFDYGDTYICYISPSSGEIIRLSGEDIHDYDYADPRLMYVRPPFSIKDSKVIETILKDLDLILGKIVEANKQLEQG